MSSLLLFALVGLALTAVLAVTAFRKISTIRAESTRTQTAMSVSLDQKMTAAEDGRRRLAAILESMIEGVMVVGADERILMVNTAFTQAFGFKKSDIENRYYWEAVRDSEVNRLVGQTLKVRQPRHEEQTVMVADAVFEIQASPVFNGDDFLGVVTVFHDVTRLKEFERLRQEFVANVSHELKTPLTSILGYLETLKDGAIEDAENRMRFLSVIEDHSKKLHRLIEDLLLLSRMESGAEPVRKEPVKLRAEVEKIFQMMARPIQTQRLAVELQIPPGLTISVEPSSFERALRNLLENAVKYNVPGGSIRVEVSSSEDGDSIRITDTGIGISEADLPRIFERFYRTDKSRSSDTGGSGLGLSIAKHVIDRHGGRIQVQSKPQKGTTFTLFLPR